MNTSSEEKAKELVIKFYSEISGLNRQYIISNWEHIGKLSLDSHCETAIKSSIIAVDERIQELEQLRKP